MLRQAQRFLLSRAAMRWRRPFSTDLAEAPADSKFVDTWKKAVPNIDPPKTPLAFMTPRPPTPSTIPSKLTVNLVLPYDSLLSAKEVYFRFIRINTISLLVHIIYGRLYFRGCVKYSVSSNFSRIGVTWRCYNCFIFGDLRII